MHPIQIAIIFLASVAATALGFLSKLRILPFLRPDAVLSGGKLVSTDELATLFSRLFFGFAAVTFLIGLVMLFAYVRRRSRDHNA